MNNNEDDEAAIRYIELILHITRCTLEMIQQAGATLAPAERDQALHILSYALDLDEAWPFVREMILLLAPKMELMGHRHDWMPILVRGIEESQRHSDCHAVAEYELQLAILYRMVSNFALAKQVAQESINHFASVGDKSGEARSLNELAWIEHIVHDYDLADMHADRALQILDENAFERGMSYRVLGMVAYYRENLIDAENFHRQALNIFEAEGNQQKIAWALQNIAMSLRQQSRFEEAFSYFSDAALRLETINDKSRWSMTQIGLGLAYYNSKNYDLAIDCYQRAHPIAQQLNDKLQLAMIQGNLALVYLARSNYERAAEHFISAISLYDQVGDTVWTLYNMEGLTSCYIKQNKYNEALIILMKIKQSLPKISASTHNQRINQLIDAHLESIQSMGFSM